MGCRPDCAGSDRSRERQDGHLTQESMWVLGSGGKNPEAAQASSPAARAPADRRRGGGCDPDTRLLEGPAEAVARKDMGS